MSLETVLADEDWDYVSLQQASPFSGMYETYEASLPELIEYVKARLPKKTKLMLHQTWRMHLLPSIVDLKTTTAIN